MERHTLKDLCDLHAYLSQVKKQSGDIKKVEKRICEQIEGMRVIGPLP
jgi:hypothetical protein